MRLQKYIFFKQNQETENLLFLGTLQTYFAVRAIDGRTEFLTSLSPHRFRRGADLNTIFIQDTITFLTARTCNQHHKKCTGTDYKSLFLHNNTYI